MKPSSLRTVLKTSISAIALGGVVFLGSLLPQHAKAQSYLPGYTTTNSFGGNTGTNINSSFGFFFDVASNISIDGLGFAAQTGWGNGTNYTVKLWSYVNGGSLPGDYTQIANATFTAGTPYTLQNNYYWQALAGGPLFLADTFTTDNTDQLGYVISAIGDFSNATGNVAFETGTPTFDPRILYAGNGFNDASDAGGYFEVPIYDGGVGDNGYFNPNFSIVQPSTVPGPLPLLGAAAGFSWTRRLRQRIRASK
jgi:hypothetical protein